jgi:GTP-binding protein EngB required for normal cell division
VSTLIDNPANQHAYTELVKTLRGGGAIALIGAGSSARVGYPVWSRLLALMAEEILRQRPLVQDELTQLAGAEDQLWRAEEYRRLLGPDQYAALMRQIFGPQDVTVDRFHELLVRLPFRHVLTTNYDPVLEDAHTQALRSPPRRVEWRDQADVQEFIQKLGDPADHSRRYVYLHGRYNDPESLVLAESDYSSHYHMRADTLPKLWSLMATQRVVSIGFSLSDLDLMALFRLVKGQLGHGAPRHFAVLALDSRKDSSVERRRLTGKYGIEPVFYPWSENHAALVELVEKLVRDTDAGRDTSGSSHGVARAVDAPTIPESHPESRPPLLTAGHYVRLQREARAVVERLEALGKQLGWKSVEARVGSLRAALRDNLYRVAMTGKSRAGKSSLLNALLGRPICPVQRIITTGVPINIVPGDQERAIIRFENGPSVTLEAPLEAGHLAPFAAQQHNPDNHKRVASIEVQLTHEVLDLGVAYIDLPGLDDPSDRLSEGASKVLSAAHALLLVIDVSSYSSGGFALDRQTIGFLRQMHDRSAPTFMVCNKSDRLTEAEQQDLARHLRATLESHTVWDALAAPPFFLSASQACDAQKQGQPVPAPFATFSDALWKSLWRTETIGLRRLYHVFDQLRSASEEMSALMRLRQTKGPERDHLRLVLEKCDTTRAELGRRCREQVSQERGRIRNLISQVQVRLRQAVTKYVASQSSESNLPKVSRIHEEMSEQLRKECAEIAQTAGQQMENIAQQVCSEAAANLQTLRAEVGVRPSKWKGELDALPSWELHVGAPMLTDWDRYARLAGSGLFTMAATALAVSIFAGPVIGVLAGGLLSSAVTWLVEAFTNQAPTADGLVDASMKHLDKCLADFGQRIEAWQEQVADGLLAQINGKTQPFMTDIRHRLADLRPPTEADLQQHALLDEDIQRTLSLLVAIVRSPDVESRA